MKAVKTKSKSHELVGVTELAAIMGITRQAIQQKVKSKELVPDMRDGHGRAYWSWESAQSYRVQSKGVK